MDIRSHVDYIPSVFGYTKRPESEGSVRQREERQKRVDKRRRVPEETEHDEGNYEDLGNLSDHQDNEEWETVDVGTQTESCLMVDGDVQTSRTETTEATTQASFVPTTPTTPIVCYVPVESQVESTTTTFTSELLKDNDEMTKFYTGLPSWKVFHHLVCFLSTCCPALSSSITKVSLSDSLLLTLMKLRLNLRLEDLSYRFGIPVSTAADVFHKLIATMHAHLKFLIEWPTQETCRTNMPQIFKDLYPRARCIIDCSEIFIERPCSYQARAQTYSNYKKHNTIKFLVGITPSGAISFLSECWGGLATDKCITMNSGFLRLLEPGDIILAD